MKRRRTFALRFDRSETRRKNFKRRIEATRDRKPIIFSNAYYSWTYFSQETLFHYFRFHYFPLTDSENAEQSTKVINIQPLLRSTNLLPRSVLFSRVLLSRRSDSWSRSQVFPCLGFQFSHNYEHVCCSYRGLYVSA